MQSAMELLSSMHVPPHRKLTQPMHVAGRERKFLQLTTLPPNRDNVVRQIYMLRPECNNLKNSLVGSPLNINPTRLTHASYHVYGLVRGCKHSWKQGYGLHGAHH